MFRAKLAAFVLAMAFCVGSNAETISKTACQPSVEASRDLVLSFYKPIIHKILIFPFIF